MTEGDMSIFREDRCEDDFSWDRGRRSTVSHPKITHITDMYREGMREKVVRDVLFRETETSTVIERETKREKNMKSSF